MKSFTPLLVLSMLFFTATVVKANDLESENFLDFKEDFSDDKELSDYDSEGLEDFYEPEEDLESDEILNSPGYRPTAPVPIKVTPPVCKKSICNLINGVPDWLPSVSKQCKENYAKLSLLNKASCQTSYCNRQCVKY